MPGSGESRELTGRTDRVFCEKTVSSAGGRDTAFRFFALCIFNARKYYRFLHSWYYLPRSLSEGVTFLYDVKNFPPLPHRELRVQAVPALGGAFFQRPVRFLS